MNEVKYKLTQSLSLSVPVRDADKLLEKADGTAALLYLHILRAGGALSADSAALSLKRTAREIENAARMLGEMGLLATENAPAPGGQKPAPAEELPEYRAQDISERASTDPEFRAVVDETQRIFGRMLSGADLKILFGIYDYLSLPAEVILLLINHCVDISRGSDGRGRLPSMRYIEKEAYTWANREVITLAQAEEYLNTLSEKKGLLSQAAAALDIQGRKLTASESRYINDWLDMGFGPEAIELAYDRTVTNTGSLQWKYMNSIMNSWHGKRLHTVEEIEAGDVRPSSRQAAGSKRAQQPSVQIDELERLKKIRDKIKNG